MLEPYQDNAIDSCVRAVVLACNLHSVLRGFGSDPRYILSPVVVAVVVVLTRLTPKGLHYAKIMQDASCQLSCKNEPPEKRAKLREGLYVAMGMPLRATLHERSHISDDEIDSLFGPSPKPCEHAASCCRNDACGFHSATTLMQMMWCGKGKVRPHAQLS